MLFFEILHLLVRKRPTLLLVKTAGKILNTAGIVPWIFKMSKSKEFYRTLKIMLQIEYLYKFIGSRNMLTVVHHNESSKIKWVLTWKSVKLFDHWNFIKIRALTLIFGLAIQIHEPREILLLIKCYSTCKPYFKKGWQLLHKWYY